MSSNLSAVAEDTDATSISSNSCGAKFIPPVIHRTHTNRSEFPSSSSSSSRSSPVPAFHSDSGFCTLQGARKSQEDNFVMLRHTTEDNIWGVFDGHRGHSASTYAANSFTDFLQAPCPEDVGGDLVRALRQLDHNMRSSGLCNQSGTTACVARFAEGRLTVANLGDSRALLVCADASIVFRTQDHNLRSHVEEHRLRTCNANVEFDRLNGELNVTRSLGDFHFKHGANDSAWAMSNVADVYECHPSAGDFAVFATDGLWDVMTDQEVADYCAPQLRDGSEEDGFGGAAGGGTPRNLCQSVAESLVQHAVHQRRSCDNVTVIIVRFK